MYCAIVMIFPCNITCHEVCSEEKRKRRVAKRNLVDKTVFSMPNSGVQYVEKNAMTHQKKTG